jgi:hypothetical protein
MEFRIATKADIDFVAENSLYGPIGKEQQEQIDFVYTLDHGDYILGVGGFRMVTDSTAWGWIELSGYIGNHLVPTIRVIQDYMKIFCSNHKIRRLQAWVASDFPEGIRTAKHLGFVEECTMIDFLGKGKNAILLVQYFNGDN